MLGRFESSEVIARDPKPIKIKKHIAGRITYVVRVNIM